LSATFQKIELAIRIIDLRPTDEHKFCGSAETKDESDNENSDK
jgi:hypothetical protein